MGKAYGTESEKEEMAESKKEGYGSKHLSGKKGFGKHKKHGSKR